MRAQQPRRSAAIVSAALLIAIALPEAGHATPCSTVINQYTTVHRKLLDARRTLEQMERSFSQVRSQHEGARADLVRGNCNSPGSNMALCAKAEPRLSELTQTLMNLQADHSAQVRLVGELEQQFNSVNANRKLACGPLPPPAAPRLSQEEYERRRAQRQVERTVRTGIQIYRARRRPGIQVLRAKQRTAILRAQRQARKARRPGLAQKKRCNWAKGHCH
jgi:hypothetical protein